ncbi:MAG TPA: hypothetical protein VJ650_09885 [Gemmatimonadaceae bacterium]|nr:hypothetical protein [Gemmatimonadaceae bacterium]
MSSMITARAALALMLLGAACSEPSGPAGPPMTQQTTVEVVRQRPTVPGSIPDSVGIPPSIPPIYEEAPPGFDGPQ